MIRTTSVGIGIAVCATLLAGCSAGGAEQSAPVTVTVAATGQQENGGAGQQAEGQQATGGRQSEETGGEATETESQSSIPVHGATAYTITASGKTRCNLHTTSVECQSREFGRSFTTGDGQPATGFTYHPGALAWNNGNMALGSEEAAHPTVLQYGRKYLAFGWVVTPSAEETVFTQSGHGVRVSITRVTTF